MMRALIPLLLLARPAAAEIVVTLEPGGGRLVVENASGCDAGPFEFIFDLRLAGRGARFAAPETGAPFAVEEGERFVAAAAHSGSNGTVLTLALNDLPAGARLALSLDLADRRGAWPADLSGAVAAVAFRHERTDAALGAEGVARLRGFGCLG